METKKEYIQAIKELIGEGGAMYFEHGYTSTLSIRENETMYACTPTQVLVRKRITNIFYITSRVNIKDLPKLKVRDIYNELMNYYKYVKEYV